TREGRVDAAADLEDLSGHLEPGPGGGSGGGRMQALHLQQIRPVDSRARDLDEHLVGAGLRIGEGSGSEVIAVDVHDAHAHYPSRPTTAHAGRRGGSWPELDRAPPHR